MHASSIRLLVVAMLTLVCTAYVVRICGSRAGTREWLAERQSRLRERRSSRGRDRLGAQVQGEPITTSVYTDADGRYYFPAMKSGRYRVWAQAVGFERAEASVALGRGVGTQTFTLKETTDLIPQLSGYQIMAALPEDTVAHRRGKVIFHRSCTYCHEASTALQNRFDQAGWEVIVGVMLNGFQQKNQKPLTPLQKELAAYLTEMRGPGTSPMRPKPFRVSGASTLPVVYDVRRAVRRRRLCPAQRQRLAVRPRQFGGWRRRASRCGPRSARQYLVHVDADRAPSGRSG